MNSELKDANPTSRLRLPCARVALSPWVNELLPPISELLSAHDVARLTRRHRWIVAALAAMGRFPKQRSYRGCTVGWLRSEIMDWMTRHHSVLEKACERLSPKVYGAGRSLRGGRQIALGLGSATCRPRISSHRTEACGQRRRRRR